MAKKSESDVPAKGEHRVPKLDQSQFRVLVKGYLDSLGWSQPDLHKTSGVGDEKLTSVLTRSKKPLVATRFDVCRITWAIAGGFDGVFPDRQPKGEASGPGRVRLDALLNELLESAGYAAIRGRDFEEQEWDPLESTCRHASLSIL